MKSFIIFGLLNIILMKNVFSESDSIQQAEILISNSTTHQITVKVFPIGAIFSGHHTPPNAYVQKYSSFKEQSK